MNAQKLFVTFGGTGLAPRPLVTASVLATLIALPIITLVGMETLFMLTFVITIIAVFEVNKYLASYPDGNEEQITIDDAAGVWMSLMVSLSTAMTLHLPYALYIGTILTLLFFLLFQTWRPSTIGWMHRTLKGGLGIILSSILSGLAGGLLSVAVLMGLEKIL